jgi:hypothetical protein
LLLLEEILEEILFLIIVLFEFDPECLFITIKLYITNKEHNAIIANTIDHDIQPFNTPNLCGGHVLLELELELELDLELRGIVKCSLFIFI